MGESKQTHRNPMGKASKAIGKASKTNGKASETIGKASENLPANPMGKPAKPIGKASETNGKASEADGKRAMPLEKQAKPLNPWSARRRPNRHVLRWGKTLRNCPSKDHVPMVMRWPMRSELSLDFAR